jgi:hypothetical protein
MILTEIFDLLKMVQVADPDLTDIRLSKPDGSDLDGTASFPYLSVLLPLQYSQEANNRQHASIDFTLIVYYRRNQERTVKEVLHNQDVCLAILRRYIDKFKQALPKNKFNVLTSDLIIGLDSFVTDNDVESAICDITLQIPPQTCLDNDIKITEL